jgi:hypothetical protein
MLLGLVQGDIESECHARAVDLSGHLMDVAWKDCMCFADGCAMRGATDKHGRGLAVKRSPRCGALSAAIAVLYCTKGNDEAAVCQDGLMDWFCGSYGGYHCYEIAEAPGIPKDALCPKLILMTYLQLRGYIGDCKHLAKKSVSFV